MNFKKLNDLAGWVVFLIATVVYFLTLEPTASWWDCGEYIATAYKLQVGHPPGAPLFQMLGRFFSLFAFGDLSKVALMINAMSALSASFTILFLFWTITLLARKFMLKGDDTDKKSNQYAVLAAGAVGALAYTFSDSFWFSAVEGEVYAMSSFFTAVVFWAILRWERVADQPHHYRWLIFIAYLIGLSIGVHLLNLLALPAIVYVFYFKKFKPTTKGFILAGIISVAILGFIMSFMIPQIVNIASKFELFFVNSLGMPFNTGTIIYFAILIAAIVFGLYYTQLKRKVILNTVLLSFMFILIGYSSFFLIVIRANANTPINENEPSDAISLLSYLNREQYGDWPLLYGQYYNAPKVDYKDGSPVYVKDKKAGKYVITDNRASTIPVYDDRFTTVFPRMWGEKASHISVYKRYGGDKGTPIRITKNDGTTQVINRPTFGENLKFFTTYQLSHMYFRYFMWNFAGRQNDVESQGEYENGNWISGINFIDSARLGSQSNLPDSMKNPMRAKFYFLPLLLGLAGLFFHLKRNVEDTWIVFLLFVMTGIAIVVYLNQTPYQPRERDYAYAGSFYAFAIWIGFGVLFLYDLLAKFFNNKKTTAALAAAGVSLLLVPGIMAVEGWEGHDRSGKYAARDFAMNYLAQCDPNAIIFTNGDNDTFPLWYVQEVENFRTDMRVVNYMLASGDWYVHQLGKKVYESERLPLTLTPEQYNKGINEYTPIFERVQSAVELKEAIEFIADERDQTKVPMQSGEKINYLPTKKLKLTVDRDAVIRSGIVPKELEHLIVDVIEWEVTQGGLYKNDLMLLDLIATNNWQRPIYFANPNSVSKVFNVDKYCHMEGLVYKFMPVLAPEYYKNMGGVYAKGSYDLLVNKARWGNVESPKVTIDRESFRNAAIAKQSYMRLAQALLNEGKADSAVIALDKSLEFFPHKKVPFDYFMLPWIDIYFEAGANDKALGVMESLAERYLDDLKYYTGLKGKYLQYYDTNMQEAMAVLQRLSETARKRGLKDFQQKMDDALSSNMMFFGLQ